jgi:hypothetical protein
MVKANRRPIECGKVRVQFVARKDMERTPIVEKNTPRGMLRVSSPEATALELVGYADQSAGLDNVASVLAELAPSLNSDRLVIEATRSPIAWGQRLGYLLDITEHRELADKLAPHVKEHAHVVAPLVRSSSKAGVPRDARWNLAVNAKVEPDL